MMAPARSGRGRLRLDRLAAIFFALLLAKGAMAQSAVTQSAAPDSPAIASAGLVVEGSVAAVLQQVNGGGTTEGTRQRRASYRGDLTASLPAPGVGESRGSIFGHLRLGQGEGLTTRPTYTGSVNSLAFETSGGSGSSFAILAELFYQLDLALGQGIGASGGESNRQRIEFTVGKMDPFVFFDQNAVAGDESTGFLNNVFVHNPLLDSGGDLGADRYGFTPGVRAAWFDERSSRYAWGASVGVFGAGSGAVFGGPPGKPFVIAQLELSPRRADGEAAGTYRLYGWRNAQAESVDESPAKHAGWGVSIDQRVGADLNFFGRLGRRTVGRGTFDRAVTVGFEIRGNRWGRANDGIGVALGSLATADAYRAASADGTLAGFAASGREKILEIFYRYAVNEKIEISPDFQMVRQPGGDPAAPTARVYGVRANFSF